MGAYVSQLNGGSGRELTIDIVSQIAKAEGIEPTELPPIHNSIDCDALEQIVTGPSLVDAIEFSYYGWKVTVSPGADVTISNRSAEA